MRVLERKATNGDLFVTSFLSWETDHFVETLRKKKRENICDWGNYILHGNNNIEIDAVMLVFAGREFTWW